MTTDATHHLHGRPFVTDEARRRPRSLLASTITFSAIVEASTAVALVIAPATVERWLLGTGFTGVVLGRCFGIALLALGVACWPTRERSAAQAFRALMVYNAAIALYLTLLRSVDHHGGPLLWPAVAVHTAVVLALAWGWRATRRTYESR